MRRTIRKEDGMKLIVGVNLVTAGELSAACSSTSPEPPPAGGETSAAHGDKLPTVAITPREEGDQGAGAAKGLLQEAVKTQDCSVQWGWGGGDLLCANNTCDDPCAWYCCGVVWPACAWYAREGCS
jgi:hypothetical protein